MGGAPVLVEAVVEPDRPLPIIAMAVGDFSPGEENELRRAWRELRGSELSAARSAIAASRNPMKKPVRGKYAL